MDTANDRAWTSAAAAFDVRPSRSALHHKIYSRKPRARFRESLDVRVALEWFLPTIQLWLLLPLIHRFVFFSGETILARNSADFGFESYNLLNESCFCLCSGLASMNFRNSFITSVNIFYNLVFMNEIQDFTALIRRRVCWWGVGSPSTLAQRAGPEGSKISNNWMWAGFAAGTVVFVVRLFLRRIRLRERKKKLISPSICSSFVRSRLDSFMKNLHVYNPYARLLQRRSSVSEKRETTNCVVSPGEKTQKFRFQFHEWTANRCQMMNENGKKTTRETRTNENKFTTCNAEGERSKSSSEIRWMGCFVNEKGDEGGWSLCERNTEWASRRLSPQRKKV